jgi:hypothetical protein
MALNISTVFKYNGDRALLNEIPGLNGKLKTGSTGIDVVISATEHRLRSAGKIALIWHL